MDDISTVEKAIELLQQLGLKEYEAKSFVALSRLPNATAKRISEISDVPRTRVYDAVRVLESEGLVEIQHTNPQRFRAVSLDEAADTLEAKYDSRTESLREVLRNLEPADDEQDSDAVHEIWALSGTATISSRTRQLLDEADREAVLIIGDEELWDEALGESLRSADAQGVNILIGTVSESLRDDVQSMLPDADVFVSGLDWLRDDDSDDDTEITRLLLVDQSTILVSTRNSINRKDSYEQAVFGRGFDNGLVTLVRRLMSTGLLPIDSTASATS